MAKLIYDKMSLNVMKAACEKLGLKPSNTAVATASVLSRWFASNTTKEDVSTCSTCNGKSDYNLAACPYCGDGDKVTPGENGEAVVVKGEAEAAQDAGEAERTDPQAAPPLTEPPPAAVAALKGVKPPKPKKGSKGTIVVAAEPAEAAAALVGEKSEEEKKLDGHVQKIAGLRRQSAEDLWALGHEIYSIYLGELWMARKRADGKKPLYTQFAKFCEVELGMSRPLAYQLMDIAKTFSVEQIRQYGATKLGLVVKLPDKERDRLLAQFGTKRQLQAAVRGARGGSGTGGGATAGGGGEGQPTERAISAMVRMGEQSVVGLLRGGAGNGKRHPVAKTLADHPWGVEKHGNGVETHYSIRANDETGALELVIERRRT